MNLRKAEHLMIDMKELTLDMITPEVAAEFRSYCVPLNGHTRWDGDYNDSGRPTFTFGGKTYYAARVAFLIANRWISNELLVRHKCDQPWCVDAGCLELGTHQDNSDDMTSRGRSRRGEEHVQSRFTEQEIMMMRASDEPYDELARQFGTSLRYIVRTKEFRTWTWMHSPIYIHPDHERFVAMLEGKRAARDLSRKDIQTIVAYEGSAEDALHELGITKKQFDYVRENYNSEGKLNYRKNLDVISYD